MTSDDESNVNLYGESKVECHDDSDSESANNLTRGSNLEQLKSIQEKVNWEIEEDRHELLRKLSPLILDWQGQLPNFRDIFRREEIDLLIIDCITNIVSIDYSFVNFVLATGYKDEPDVDEDGKPLLLRTTAVHHGYRLDVDEIYYLFEIYNRFDVNYTDEDGLTHFHVACFFGHDDIVKNFLELGQDPNILLPETGDSPLHLSQEFGFDDVTEWLLRYGADPNWANKKGVTPLHRIFEDAVAEVFFKFDDEKYQPLQVNAQTKLGNTPLHVALNRSNIKTAELLLKRGADPNLANEKGATPLHVLSERNDLAMIKLFFKINAELNQQVHIDARDKLGRTPLQWAVANHCPVAVDVLLDRGADLSCFVYPSTSDFDSSRCFEYENDWPDENKFDFYEMSGALAVVERLKNSGYELKRSDALTIITLFIKHATFKKSAHFDEFIYDDEKLVIVRFDDDNDDEEEEEVRVKEFTAKAKKIMVSPNLSLYDLIRLQPKEAVKQLTYRDFYELANEVKWRELPERYHEAVKLHLREKLSRGFFRRWALYPFWKLTRYQLPILCCKMIVEQLMSQDLCNICLAAASPSS